MCVQQNTMLASQSITDVVRALKNNLPTNINHQSVKVLVIAALLFVLGSGFAFGKTTQWIGTASSSWADPANWSNGVPGLSDDAVIPTIDAANHQPVISSNISIGSLQMDSHLNTITVSSGANVDILGNVTIAPDATFSLGQGNLNVGGSLSVSGVLTVTTGTITTGTIAIPDGGKVDMGDGNLKVNSASSVYGELDLNSGTIDFLGNLDLHADINMSGAGVVNVGTSTSSVTFTMEGGTNFNLNNGTLNIYGSSSMTGGGTLNVTGGAVNFYDNSSFSGGGTLNGGSGDVYFGKNVTVAGNIYAQNSTITMDGSTWDMEWGTFDPGNSTFVFSGDIQMITGPRWEDITFYNLIVTDSAQVTAHIYVTVNNSMTVDPPATFNVDNLHTLDAPASAKIYKDATIVYGGSASLAITVIGKTNTYTVVYTDGNRNYTLNNYTTGSEITVSPTVATTYSIVSVRDQYGDYFSASSLSGTAKITVTPDTEAPQFTNCSSNITVAADPGQCSAKVWYNTPTATDNTGAYAGSIGGFSFLGMYNGHSFYLSDSKMTPEEAQAKALEVGGHLATISSNGELDFLVKNTPWDYLNAVSGTDYKYWIGFSDAKNEGDWQWVTGEPVTYTNWSTGTLIGDQPNNLVAGGVDQDWAEFWNFVYDYHQSDYYDFYGEWNDGYNNSTLRAIIEFEGPKIKGEMQNEGDPTWYPAPAPGSSFSVGVHHMRFTCADVSGNTAVCPFDITVTESEPPTITAPADVTVSADAGSCYATNVDLGTPTTSDNCGVKSVTNDAPTSFPEGTTTVTWTVTDKSGNTATDTQDVTVTSNGVISGDDQNTEGNDSWIGHIYNGTNFQDYYGYTTEPQEFDENFGGSQTCYDFSNSSGGGSIYTETFSVHYRMHSTLDGIYLVDIGSDDGARLYVDNNLVYTHWSNRGYATDAGILFGVNGNNDLLLDFYENGGANRISFKNLQKVNNTLTSGNTQDVCINSTPAAIVGNDVFADSPISGNTSYTVAYQWQESTDGTNFTGISGATGKDYTPPATTAGKTYYQRVLTVSRTNPGMSTATVATSVSDVAEITVNPEVATPIFADGTTSTRCQGAGTVTYSATAANATAITYSLDATSLSNGNTINASTGDVTYVDTWSGTSVITVTAEGCGGPKTATHTVITTPSVGVPTPITVSAGSEPACPPETGTLTTTYSSTATNSTGLVWSIDDPSAGSIDPSTGVMTWAQGFSGTVNIKLEATGCNGPTMASRTVTVEDTENPVIDDLSDLSTSVCASDETASPQYEVVNGIDLPPARVHDNCSSFSNLTISYTITQGGTVVGSGTGTASGQIFNEGTSIVTYYVTDASNNKSAGKSFSVTVNHKPNPGIITAN